MLIVFFSISWIFSFFHYLFTQYAQDPSRRAMTTISRSRLLETMNQCLDDLPRVAHIRVLLLFQFRFDCMSFLLSFVQNNYIYCVLKSWQNIQFFFITYAHSDSYSSPLISSFLCSLFCKSCFQFYHFQTFRSLDENVLTPNRASSRGSGRRKRPHCVMLCWLKSWFSTQSLVVRVA